MADDIAISLKNISKVFKQYHHPVDRLKEILLPGKQHGEEFWALKDITLEIPKGETIGIIGRNGSGKSTLLQIIAGTLQATAGEIIVNGRISALLELGSGFNPEFTGRQNVFFNGRILGLSKEEITARFDQIVAFANIGEFIDQPVKVYSSGMFVRLAFSVAIHVDPDILIVDEALSVGDGIFVHKCISKIKDFQEAGGTILFVSHDAGSINRLCSKCLWINSGHIVEHGLPIDVSKSYQAWVYQQINQQFHATANTNSTAAVHPELPVDKPPLSNQDTFNTNKASSLPSSVNAYTNERFISFSNVERCGTGRCELTHFKILDEEENDTNFCMPEQTLVFSIKCIAHDTIKQPIVGIQMFDRLRVPVIGWNTWQYKCSLPSLEKGDVVTVLIELKWPHLKSDNYTLEPAVADGTQESHEILDWLFSPIALQSGESELTFGFLRMTDVKVSHEVKKTSLLVFGSAVDSTVSFIGNQ